MDLYPHLDREYYASAIHVDKAQNSEVQSKYFLDSKDNTDDSVSEFQEPKKSVKGLQKAKVASKPKSKPTKKPIKRSRGQKDIRTALKSKKNDLITYSEDFDSVCKQSGLDVDAEQLQLAIALSKSLQHTEETPEPSSESSQPSTSQERVGKIRKTLQQYGFKVPEVKINTGVTKRGRKKRKESKLLLTTEAERQQSIADKYSQVLFDNVLECDVVASERLERNEDTLYHIATNISYESMKDIKVFYVKELLDDTTSAIGSLLRDWSKIPGRPLSPIKKYAKVKLEEMNLSPEEVDTILSGSVVEAQDILKSKNAHEELDVEVNVLNRDSNDTLEIQEISKKLTETSNVLEMPQSQVRSYSPDLFEDELSSIDNSKCLSQNICSQPDSQKSVPNLTSRKTNDFMDLTECVDVFPLPPTAGNNNKASTYELQIVNSASNSQKSDDMMEITECVAADPKTMVKSNNIDLTQESDEKEENTLVNVHVNETVVKIDNNIDLTQSDHSDDDTLPLVYISGQKTRSFDQDINGFHFDEDNRSKEDSPIKIKSTFTDKNTAVNLINSDDEIELNNSKGDVTSNKESNFGSSKQGSIFEEFVFEHSDHQSSKNSEAKLSDISDNNAAVAEFGEDDHIDLTQNTDSSKHSSVDELVPPIIHGNSILGKRDDVSIDYDEVYMNDTVENVHNTQSRSETSETNENKSNDTSKQNVDVSIDYDEVYMNQTVENICTRQHVNESSENKNLCETSELNDGFKQSEANSSLQTDIVQNNKTADNFDDYIDIVNDDVQIHIPFEEDHQTPTKACNSMFIATPEPSQEVFEISDEELNYSMHKSNHLMNNSQESQEYNLPDNDQGNFDFGGISILDNISGLQDNQIGAKGLATSKILLHKSASESFVQSIEIKGTKVKMKSPTKISRSEATTPTKELHEITYGSLQTPNNTEYLIKMHHVTPMADYTTMATPDRNKELEKYGLKPIIRKRAIQLLTHIYTQTHPVVENNIEENQPSPSKKRKHDDFSHNSPIKPIDRTPNKTTSKSPRKYTKSPRKFTKSPAKSCTSKNSKEDGIEKENVNYVETSSVAVLKDIECSPEDWVFQKREKAKVHSCRVPLHVAFHNYVASRRCLREAILRYEPVNIEVIHKDLVGYGHRFDPKDLLRFLDKKCITVKTSDSNGRNNKKS